MARLIGIVTTARSDFGCLRPLIQAVAAHAGLDLRLYVSGTHLSDVNGQSALEVMGEFGSVARLVPCVIGGDQPGDLGQSMGQILSGFAAVLAAERPDILVVLGDRWDMIPAVLAAVPFNIPVAHLSGGEVTEGVIDDAIRHAVTKLAHLHFPACAEYGARLRQLGEEDWRIHVTGEPGLDYIATMTVPSRHECLAPLGLDPDRPVSLFTYHPETIGHERTGQHIATILRAAQAMLPQTQILFTHPNSDTGSGAIIQAIQAFAQSHAGCVVIPSLGRVRFFDVMHHCAAIVGNSSSGVVESASFKLPAINVGDRQKGRIAPENVIHAPIDSDAVRAAWTRALDPDFRQSLALVVNPYGDGRAAGRIAGVLADIALDHRLILKRFQDLPQP